MIPVTRKEGLLFVESRSGSRVFFFRKRVNMQSVFSSKVWGEK